MHQSQIYTNTLVISNSCMIVKVRTNLPGLCMWVRRHFSPNLLIYDSVILAVINLKLSYSFKGTGPWHCFVFTVGACPSLVMKMLKNNILQYSRSTAETVSSSGFLISGLGSLIRLIATTPQTAKWVAMLPTPSQKDQSRLSSKTTRTKRCSLKFATRSVRLWCLTAARKHRTPRAPNRAADRGAGKSGKGQETKWCIIWDIPAMKFHR